MDLESVDEVLRTTRSVRRRLDFERPIPAEVLEQCIEIATGKIEKQERIGTGGNWGSLALVGERLYVTNTGGQTLVLTAKKDFKVLATNSVNEMTRGSPAFSDGQVFLRTHKTLWCFGK